MDKNQVLDYVMNSPANTNKAVLSDMLDGLSGGGTGNFLLHEVTETFEGREFTRLDRTWQEINDAFLEGKRMVLIKVQEYEPDEGESETVYTAQVVEAMTAVFHSTGIEDCYEVIMHDLFDESHFSTGNPNNYPTKA